MSTFYEVAAPVGFTNRALNGSECVPVRWHGDAVTVLLLTGPQAGREWQVSRAHLSTPTPEPEASNG